MEARGQTAMSQEKSSVQPTLYKTPQTWLAGLWEERKRKNSRYSLRAFAQGLGLSPSTLSQVMSGKRPFSIRVARQVFEALGIDPSTREHIMRLITRDKLGTTPSPSDERMILDTDRFHSISEWYHYGILGLGSLRKNRCDPRWIAGRLRITPSIAAQALDRLLRLNLIEKKGTGFRQHTAPLSFSSSIANSAIRNFHQQILELAQRSLEEDPLEDRDFGVMTMAIDPEKLPQARIMIKEFRRELSKFLEEGESQRVYSLAIQLFPIDKGP